jgi:hypothetical protein
MYCIVPTILIIVQNLRKGITGLFKLHYGHVNIQHKGNNLNQVEKYDY